MLKQWGCDLETAKKHLEAAFALLLTVPEIRNSIDVAHIQRTPQRIADMYEEFFSGCFHDPKEILSTGWIENKYNEMVYVNDMDLVSFCAHHTLPFFGKCHFAYIPDKKIVGLSKIPRFIEILSKRPQVQEKLSQEIVDTFWDVVKPMGCGVVIEAYHMCMMIRGVKKEGCYTKTTALQGRFYEPSVKAEFLDGIRKNGDVWP